MSSSTRLLPGVSAGPYSDELAAGSHPTASPRANDWPRWFQCSGTCLHLVLLVPLPPFRVRNGGFSYLFIPSSTWALSFFFCHFSLPARQFPSLQLFGVFQSGSCNFVLSFRPRPASWEECWRPLGLGPGSCCNLRKGGKRAGPWSRPPAPWPARG